MFGTIQTHPLYIIHPGEPDAFGYIEDYETVEEFEGVIDFVSGNRRNDYRTIHPDTSHVIITDFNPLVIDLLDSSLGAHIKDGTGTVYTVLNVDDPAMQGHHLEIEVERMPGGVSDE